MHHEGYTFVLTRTGSPAWSMQRQRQHFLPVFIKAEFHALGLLFKIYFYII